MLATMCPYIVCASLTVMLTFWIVTALLDFILIKIEFHSRPLSVGSHAKKERGYPIRVLISIVPSYTTSPSLGWINRSPFNHIKRFKEGTRLPRLSDAELDHLLSWCEQFGQPHLYLFVRLALGTGGRYKEILCLRWTQIN